MARVTHEWSYERESMDMAGPDDDIDPKLQTKGLPIRKGWSLLVETPGDGTIVIKRDKTKGKPDKVHRRMLGKHRLLQFPVPPTEVGVSPFP